MASKWNINNLFINTNIRQVFFNKALNDKITLETMHDIIDAILRIYEFEEKISDDLNF